MAITTQKPQKTPQEKWCEEIDYAERENKKFYNRAEAANRRYLDERDAVEAEAKKFNIFYANTNILESALYSQVPKPAVCRKYSDFRDQVGRVGALILQRCLEQDLNDPTDQFDAVMRQAVQDRLVPGLGSAWLRLETQTEDIPESEGGQLTNDTNSTIPNEDESADVPAAQGDTPPQDAVPLKRIKNQKVCVDYVFWKDFVWSPCRTWNERRWTGRKVYLTREQLIERFGEEKGKRVSLNYTTSTNEKDRNDNLTTPVNEAVEKAIVYEIWDRTKREVVWYSKGATEILDTKKDFLHLENFEPCPTPMFANITTSNTVPRPDFYMIQDQYSELDTVNARISLLVQACKVVGVYNKNADGIIGLLTGAENKMIPVDNWAMFAEKGGVKGNIDWLPLEQIVNALQRLYEAREAIKGQIYELTGIADIVRGASKASETLGAQQIKAQFASVRIKKLQDEVARFASEILRIKAEIMVRHFEPEILIRKSGITRTDESNDQFVPAAIAMLKSEEGFEWRVTVQSDSMAQADYTRDKQDRIEFMSAVTGFLANALPMAQQVPEVKPVVLGLLRWGISAFKGADDIQGMVEKQLSLIENKPPAPPPPDPKVLALQMKGKQDEQKAQLDAQSKQQDMANEQQKMAMEERKNQQEMTFAQQMQQMEMAMKRFELMMEQQKLELEKQKMQMDMQFKGAAAAQDLQLQRERGQQDLQFNEQAGEQKLEQGAQAHEQALAQKAAEPKGEAE